MDEKKIREIKARFDAFERKRQEFAETHEFSACDNCRRAIKPGETINVIGKDALIFCCIECLADYVGGWELEFDDDPESDYWSWFKKKGNAE